mgnify:CR=1 FL=1
MTTRDHKDIQTLYYIHRFIPASIARLYGLSHQRILKILGKNTMSNSDTECLLCGLEEIIDPFYIDNDDNNANPQNVIMLCEADRRRIRHLQMRRFKLPL